MRIAAAFAAAFLLGAVSMFAVVNLAAVVAGVIELPFQWRVAAAGAGLLPLAAVDVHALRRSSCCPLGLRRQTPRILIRRYRMDVVATIWGFDTGLVVTTFRVAAITWGALLLAALGLSPRWAGVGYAIGFALPFLILLWRPQLGRAAHTVMALDPGFEVLLRLRSVAQAFSAALLLVGGSILIAVSMMGR